VCVYEEGSLEHHRRLELRLVHEFIVLHAVLEVGQRDVISGAGGIDLATLGRSGHNLVRED
jgi:hypothetical protein